VFWSVLVGLWCVRKFLVVLSVRNVMFLLVFLKMLVICVVSFPVCKCGPFLVLGGWGVFVVAFVWFVFHQVCRKLVVV